MSAKQYIFFVEGMGRVYGGYTIRSGSRVGLAIRFDKAVVPLLDPDALSLWNTVQGTALMTKKRPTDKAWFKVNHNVLDSNKFRALPISAQSLYMHLTRLQNWYCNGKPGTFEQRDWQLINETGLPERTIQRDKKELREKGFIKTNRQGPKGPTVYTVLKPTETKNDKADGGNDPGLY